MDKPPLFIDLETRSACDLRARGAHAYARDATTRLLTVAWQVDGADHVWLPGLKVLPDPGLIELHLPGVAVHAGAQVPEDLVREADRRVWVGHNAWTFDRVVWKHRTQGFDAVEWFDTYPLALAAGLPGGLDKIGKKLLGEGKYAPGANSLKKAMRATGPDDCEPENVPVGQLLLVAKYNVQDVRVTARAYEYLRENLRLTDHERRVLSAHHAINERGVRVDRKLVLDLIELTQCAKAKAIEEIARITNGELPDQAAVQSRAKVLAWLDRQGFKFSSLKRDLVARFIDTHTDDAEDEQTEGDQAAPPTLPVVVRVLQLRLQALRITGGKLDSALHSIDEDGRARGLFVYWGAHTGRWAGRRIQVQNLPRPKDGVDVWGLIRLAETGGLTYQGVWDSLPFDARGSDGQRLYPLLSVDDAASALVRNIFVGNLAAADYAAIECRVLAWMAGEQWLLDAFWRGECPYLKMAERIVNRPRDQWPEYPDPKTGKPLPLKKHPYRQIVGKIPELAAGYQVGGAKLELYAAGMGFDLRAYGVTGNDAVKAYRMSHPAICGRYEGEWKGRPIFKDGLWHQLNSAALTTLNSGQETHAGRCRFNRRGGCLVIALPSGRELVYHGARVDQVSPEWAKAEDKTVPAVVYESPRYGKKYLYGGAFAENVVQACARDILASALVRLEGAGIPVVLHCHDEAVADVPSERFQEFMGLMTECPEWLTGFPLDAEGSVAGRYCKSPPPGVKDVVWRNGKPL